MAVDISVRTAPRLTNAVYDEGYDAFLEFGDIENPYPKGSPEHANWARGFVDAVANDDEPFSMD